MPKTIEIRITIPDGAQISIEEVDTSRPLEPAPPTEQIKTYWRQYLSDNGRKVYRAAARIEDFKQAPFTLDEIAESLSVPTETVLSWHRTSGRTAKKWRDQNGTQEPIRLEDVDYKWDDEIRGMRTTYRLPPGVAAEINELAMG